MFSRRRRLNFDEERRKLLHATKQLAGAVGCGGACDGGRANRIRRDGLGPL